jgi:hypothetical protein
MQHILPDVPLSLTPALAVVFPLFHFDVKRVMETTFLTEPGPLEKIDLNGWVVRLSGRLTRR